MGGRNRGVAGAPLMLAWRGENLQSDDVITIVPADAPAAARGALTRVGDRKQGPIPTPDKPGQYEARYIATASGKIRGRYPVKLSAPAIGLDAPHTVVKDSRFTISWQQSVHGTDIISLVPAQAGPEARGEYFHVDKRSEATLRAPFAAGSYEIRYFSKVLGKLVDRAEFQVFDRAIELQAPDMVPGGGAFRVASDRVLHPLDSITVARQEWRGEKSLDKVAVGERRFTMMQAPAEPGEYKLRYLPHGQSHTIGSVAFKVVKPGVELQAPDTALAATSVEVSFSEVIHPRDWITIVQSGAPKTQSGPRVAVGNNRSITVPVPVEPGGYEIRYLLDRTGRAISSEPLGVSENPLRVSVPDSVQADQRLEVRWSDTIDPRDFVTIVPKGAPPDWVGAKQRVGTGTGGRLQAPAVPGHYEVRYMLQASGTALTATPIEVVGDGVEFSAPEQVTAGTRFTVGWDRRFNPQDMIVIAPAQAPLETRLARVRVKNRDDAKLTAPAQPGRYEIRYLSPPHAQPIGRRALRVDAARVELSAPGTVTGGQRFTVRWSPRIHPRDLVYVVPADAGPHVLGELTRAGERSQLELTAPAKPDDYELRYRLQHGDAPVARAPLQVVAPAIELSAPAEVSAGTRFTVRWGNAINTADKVTIVPADAAPAAYDRYLTVGERRSGRLRGPDTPGRYEVRYLLAANGRAIARVPVTVN